VQDVGQSLADSFGLERPHGALVSQVEPDGPAQRAGVSAGDVIVSVDGKAIERSGQLSAIISQLKPGARADLEIWRNRAMIHVNCPITELKEGQIARLSTTAPDTSGGARLGLALRPLGAGEKRGGAESGLLVEKVSGAAQEADVMVGDVVVGANGHKVTTVGELESQIAASKGSVALLVNRRGAHLFIPVRIGH
jgi:serine protease Do